MISLSPRTHKLLEALYASENERKNVAVWLETRCGDNVPFCDKSTPEQMERIRFAVLKLASEGQRIDRVIDETCKDWRDTLMAAGFGGDVRAHELWANDVIKELKR